MSEAALQDYPEWLARQVEFRGKRSHDELLSMLHAWEFVWLVPHDDNRIQDAHDLRREFFNEIGIKHYVETDILGAVSVLEILIVLSRRMGFMTDVSPEKWAEQLIHNLGLQGMAGHIGPTRAAQIEEVLEALVWRNYKSNGEGGFFPLQYPQEDQRRVELWYQMNAYLNEQT